jgi:hypothetical protein
MKPIDPNESATLFFGPDFEANMKLGRYSRYFDSLVEALTYATDTLDSERRFGAYIQTASGSRYDWQRIIQLRTDLK